jgi:hypothetical protein
MPAKQEEQQITLDLSRSDFAKTMFFSRFSIAVRFGHIFICFWVENESRQVDDKFTCVFSKNDAKNSIKILKDYFSKIGKAPSTAETSPLPIGMSFESAKPVRIVQCARNENSAEISFFFFAAHSVSRGTESKTVTAMPIAAIVSDIQPHVDFIHAFISTTEKLK